MKENVLADKSKEFALKIIKLYRYLSDSQHEYILSKQLLRCGTSIGANAKEGAYAQTKADLITKLFIAQKECAETEYWLELLLRKKKLEDKQYKELKNLCGSIRRRLIASVTTTKSKIEI